MSTEWFYIQQWRRKRLAREQELKEKQKQDKQK